jgi:hypothetical protein
LTEAKEHTAVIDKAMAKYRAKIEEFDQIQRVVSEDFICVDYS